MAQNTTSDDWDEPLQARPTNNSSTGEDWSGELQVPARAQAAGPAPVPQYSNGPGLSAGIKRGAAIGANALASGVRSAAEMPFDVTDLGNSLMGNDKFVPRNKIEAGLESVRTAVAHPIRTINNALGLGMENRPDLTPQNAAERYGAGIVEAVPNALTLAASGGMSLPRALGIAGTSAVSAQGAKDLFPGNKWAPVVGGVVGSLVAGWGTGAIKSWLDERNATKEAIAAKSAYEQAVETARTGRYDATTGVANIKAASAANLNATKDLAAESVEAAEDQARQTFGAAAKSWGTSQTLQEAGSKLQDSARDWMTRVFPEKMEALRKPLDAAIPAGTPVELRNFNGALEGINKKAGSLQPLVDVLSKAMPRQLAKASDAASEAEGLLTAGPTWGEARTLRSALGDAMKDPELVSKIGESNLQALYKSVTSDLTATAKSKGAGEIWAAFNKGSTQLHNFASNTLSKVISSTDPIQESIKPEDVASSLLSGAKKGASDLAALKAELPGAVGELSSAQLSAGSKAWGSLSPEAREVLVPDPTQRAQLNQMLSNTETASKNAQAVIREANREHAEVLAAAQADAKAGNFVRSTAIVEARRKAAEAAAKLNKENSIAGIQESLRGIKRSAVGVLAANALSPMMRHVPGGEAAMEFGAAVLPSMIHGIKGIVTRPQNALIPAAGAIAGENANTNALGAGPVRLNFPVDQKTGRVIPQP